MYKGTTPTLTFRFADFDPQFASKIVLTLANGRTKIDYTEADMEVGQNYVALTLTQEQTLALPTGTITAQLNFLMEDGSRFASKPTQFNVNRNLYSEVMV